ncbi:spore cortex formation protein SpoVR/YcgB (stage V sporulation) [Panacagrimonas perspica]|uniref:Spore cortex formation protein SpoVR/YcgB (Stage V sporulation) n=1 Tax=Panacagrimonas perspica TaxID=381431 RepID=A0A4R7NU54_9GAMM|nr:SpoVR family protein [Panacagrimonas perspica]TDU24272.1 spore cortex formation protein SpoVR/YcgB (stage V sporulation) [Panacagrimonas perspica]THD04675.1 SpoVR family protein [Panacagrimonas perspica]
MSADGGPRYLSTGAEWSFDLIARYDAAIKDIAHNEFKLDTYPNQIEIIASEQMLDAYASVGLPIGYPHWSYGKEFIRNEDAYRKGARGLAYEIVINSNPCISYLMEENTMAMQALVIAHACYGHNSFFKGNYLFRQWTNADSIIDYMVFARRYVLECEERHGAQAVEETLDSCHALMSHGIDRYRQPPQLSAEEEQNRVREREEYNWKRFDDIWRTVPQKRKGERRGGEAQYPAEPQENLLYFVEKHSPKLEPWQRELVRITRKMAQYFYPQGQTKVMNEGWATFWHYTLLNRLFDKGLVDAGFMLECLQSHTNVVTQRGFDQRGYGGVNPYALGFAMMTDLRRICENPTDEDREWFPDIAGGDWQKVLDFAMRNYKDESFIAQYLSPRLIREFHLFAVADHETDDHLTVDSIHNEQGYRRLRRLFASQYNRDFSVPDIQVTRYDRRGDRSLTVQHRRHRNRPLAAEAEEVLRHLSRLWGFTVRLETCDDTGKAVGVRDFRAG